MRRLSGLLCAFAAFAADPGTATITGRVFDVYHRPVQSARVVPMERRVDRGQERLVPGTTQAVVDAAGMYRLTLAPGSHIIAVTPPPGGLDFATVFPAYFADAIDAEKAQPVALRSGEVRPFVDFLLLDTEAHRLSGQVTGLPAGWTDSVAVSLFASSGYAGPLRTVLSDRKGRFQMRLVPAGSYELVASGPALRLQGLDVELGKDPRFGSVHVEVSMPETGGIRIRMQTGASSSLNPETRR